MKCFMHPQVEAVSVCKKCGKAMCANCSSYTDHSGICPVCRKDEFEEELKRRSSELSRNFSSIIINSILAIIVVAFAIFLAVVSGAIWFLICIADIYFIAKIIIQTLKRKPLKQRIEYLVGEIAKINTALDQGIGLI